MTNNESAPAVTAHPTAGCFTCSCGEDFTADIVNRDAPRVENESLAHDCAPYCESDGCRFRCSCGAVLTEAQIVEALADAAREYADDSQAPVARF
jgi:hypothetical protein